MAHGLTRRRIDALLVAGGRGHDFDFARLELLKLLAEHEDVRTAVRHDYSDLAALERADLVVTYTCNVRPSEAEQDRLRRFVDRGGRWLALHATNALLDVTPEGLAVATTTHGGFFELLGTKFVAHPPICDFEVRVAPGAEGHSLLRDVASFTTNDEIYLLEQTAPVEVLLEMTYVGPTSGLPATWDDPAPQPVMYLRQLGSGAVLYLTLGHCRSRWDMQPMMAEFPSVERCSWELPLYYELLRRCLRWTLPADGPAGASPR